GAELPASEDRLRDAFYARLDGLSIEQPLLLAVGPCLGKGLVRAILIAEPGSEGGVASLAVTHHDRQVPPVPDQVLDHDIVAAVPPRLLLPAPAVVAKARRHRGQQRPRFQTLEDPVQGRDDGAGSLTPA